MAVNLGSLLVSLGLDSGAFKSGLGQAEKELRASQKRIENVGKSLTGLGQKMSVAVSAPLVALGTASVKAAMESQDAIAQVNASLKSMGNQAGKTSEQLSGMAEGLMKQSLFDDDEILRKVTTNLLTFGKVQGEVFGRAQQVIVDYAAKSGKDLQASTIMVAKALQDPAKGLAALGKVGVQFSDDQKKLIEGFLATGQTAKAQGVILDELSRKTAGAAKAARDANPFAVMQQSWAEFQEKVGAQLIKAMPAITGAITSVLEAFNSLSPGMQKFAVIAGVVAVAVGPILIALGSLITVAAPLIAAFGVIAGAVGGLSGILVALGASFAGLVVALAPILIPLAAVAAAVTAVYLAWKYWPQITAFVSEVWQAVKTYVVDKVLPILEAMGGPIGLVVAIWRNWSQITEIVSRTYQAVKTWLVDKLNAVWDGVKAKIEAVKGWFYGLYDAVVGNSYIPDMVDGIAEQMKRLDAVLVDPAKKAATQTKEIFRQLATDVRGIMDSLFPEVAAVIESGKRKDTLSAGRDAGLLDRATFSEAIDRENARFNESRPANDNAPAAIAGWDENALVNMQGFNTEFERFTAAVTASIPNLGGLNTVFAELGVSGEELKQDLARAFTDVIMGAKSFGDAMRGVFNRLASKILDNMFEKLLGNLLGGIIPGFAGGTSFAPGGVALVGERGPELVNLPRGSQVIPNHDLAGVGERTVHSPTFVFPGVNNPREAREAASQAAYRYRQVMNGPVRA